MTIDSNTCRAVIYGLACGDALGKDTEFMSVRTIKQRYGATGIRELSETSGQFTDDTQMAVAVAEGLLDAQRWVGIERADAKVLGHPVCTADLNDPYFVMPHVAKRFVAWAFGPKNNRAPGNTCMGGCRNLRSGISWNKSGITRSKGCGGMMRAAPVGLVYDDIDTIARIAGAQSEITHGHKASTQAAQLTALVVRRLAVGEDPNNLFLALSSETLLDEELLGEIDPKLRDLLVRTVFAVTATYKGEIAPEEIMVSYESHLLALGESWHGDEAFASALYCFLLANARGEGYVEAVRYGANTCGDSDSIAAVAGAFAGACWGLDGEKGVPQTWIDQVEDTVELGELADRLAGLGVTA